MAGIKVLSVIFGVACGAFVGLVFGILGAMGLGILSKWANPNDPSAGSVAIVVIATAPFGAMTGAVLGGLFIAKRRRLFLVTVLPVAFLFLGWYLTLSTLREMDRPRTFVLEIAGTNGAEYAGVLTLDGKTQKLKGKIPAKFELEGFQIDLAVALISLNEKNDIAVNWTADGRDHHTGGTSQTGIFLELKSFGYSETFGGTSRSWYRMSSEEVERLFKDNAIPAGMRVP